MRDSGKRGTGLAGRTGCWPLVTLLLFVWCGGGLRAMPWQQAGSAAAVSQAAKTQSAEFFEREIRPILQHRCVECHSRALASENGELDLETAEGVAAGGSRGLLFAGAEVQQGAGLLLQAVEYADPDLQMPPAGRLPAEEIAKLQQWVRDGAVLPEYTAKPRPVTASINYSEARQFWSFRPLAQVQPPTVSAAGEAWLAGPIDAFVWQGLEQRGLEPGERADRLVLLRRASFLVTGLPPTPEEQAAILADRSDDWWQRTVDRLLGAPQYGERWARFWLDLVRYTDFTPDWQNPTDRGWLYRDWVVRAFNSNLPYDQFVRLQLAADLLPGAAPEDLAATGLLGLSPTYWKELRLAPSVIEQIVADEWDERVDCVSRTFLGLTVSCARCHDHKFDAISTEDYYGLAGVFASTQLDERPLLPPADAQRVKAARAKLRELEGRLKALSEKQDPAAAAVTAEIAQLRASEPQLDAPFAHVLRDAAVYVLPQGEEMTQLQYREGEARDLPVFRRGNPGNPGAVVPRRFLTVLSPDVPRQLNTGSGRLQLAEAITTEAAPLLARVIVNRIWDAYFGAGLVRTPSDFGIQGDRPTHPELLEYLSGQLVSRGWDLKWLQREILLSSVWRQKSVWREAADAVDPENRLLWRVSHRRLDFEMWRDAALAAAGVLDRTVGGPGQSIDDAQAFRRSLYLVVAREELHPVLRMHDFPEASSHSPRREPTTTPLQQLYFLNSAWVEARALQVRDRLQTFSGEERVRQAYALLLARQPDAEEIRVGLEFTAAQSVAGGGTPESEQAAWAEYLQALLGLSEFVTLE
ncbi:MAG: DUF1553 domain-containing protein [Planctomycetaceae bacterium]